MLFNPENLVKVLAGTKTQTRRRSSRRYFVGSVYDVRARITEKPVAYILITRAWRERLGDISNADLKAEGCRSLAEFQLAWEHINGSWEPTDIVTAYEFKLVRKRPPQRGDPQILRSLLWGSRK